MLSLTQPQQTTSFQNYIKLMKPGVMSLVVFSAYTGMSLAPGYISFFQGLLCILCITLASGAAAAINMGFDYDIDSQMHRTRNRPTVRGDIHPQNAITFGIILGIFSTIFLGVFANLYAAFWLALSIIFYGYIYTVILKRRTDQNIVIGGIAGALPPLIGWVCVDTNFHIFPWILVAIIFLWTPPHFWALSLYSAKDYQKINIPMLVITQGPSKTRLWIFIYTLLLSAPVFAPFFYGYLGSVYIAGAMGLHGYFLYQAYMLHKRPTLEQAKYTFLISIIYLFALFILMIADRILGF